MPFAPTPEEISRKDEVIAEILRATREGETIKLPAFDRFSSKPSETALISAGIEANPFGGAVGVYRYQFEGEEDLLHLIVTRTDTSPLSPQEGQIVASFLLSPLTPALIWLKPGHLSQHFYFGHDDLLAAHSQPKL